MMSPVAIEVLLRVYHSKRAPLVEEGLRQCRRNGLIRFVGSEDLRTVPPTHGYVLTDRGRAMVAALTSLRLPKKHSCWVIESVGFKCTS